MTVDEVVAEMRATAGKSVAEQCHLMLVLADVWGEAEDATRCEACNHGKPHAHPGRLYSTWAKGLEPCPPCSGTGWASNGNAARAEALRLLAVCGKAGVATSRASETGGYYGNERAMGERYDDGSVAAGWYFRMRSLTNSYDAVVERLALLDAYAQADPATRERWARETRKLVRCRECGGEGWVNDPSGCTSSPCPCGGRKKFYGPD